MKRSTCTVRPPRNTSGIDRCCQWRVSASLEVVYIDRSVVTTVNRNSS